MFTLCPRKLAAVASAIAGPHVAPLAPSERPLQFLESHPQQGKLLSLIRRTLQLIDLATPHGPMVPTQLGMEDKLQRLMALLIYPHLVSPSIPPRCDLGPGERASFASLLEAIQQDPMDNWTLTRMEQQAGLSRPQLQHQFLLIFDLKPLQWLRHQRLCWARHQLDSSAPISLDLLALRCGFSDLASFRQHFEAQFQVAPETLCHPWNVSSV